MSKTLGRIAQHGARNLGRGWLLQPTTIRTHTRKKETSPHHQGRTRPPKRSLRPGRRHWQQTHTHCRIVSSRPWPYLWHMRCLWQWHGGHILRRRWQGLCVAIPFLPRHCGPTSLLQQSQRSDLQLRPRISSHHCPRFCHWRNRRRPRTHHSHVL